MLVAPEPSWKEILGTVKQKENNTEEILTSGSAASIRLIIRGYRNVYQKSQVTILMPDFFCAETEQAFYDKDLILIKYPLDDKLEPDWKIIKDLSKNIKIDIFIFVHYFGQEHDASKARNFCNLNNALLIEDCAHVLYSFGKIGKKGDFVLFSPHKFMPIPDGGIIKTNDNNEAIQSIKSEIRKSIEGKNNEKWYLWRIKKSILKIFKVSKTNKMELGPHYIDDKERNEERNTISEYSKKILSNYTYEKLKETAYKRRENLQIMNEIICSIDADIRVMTDDKTECPLFAVYSLENVIEPYKVIEKVKKQGFIVSYWPSLKKETKSLTNEYNKLAKYIITVPIHQSLSINKIAKRIPIKTDNLNLKIEVEKLVDSIENEKKWNEILSKSSISNITQSWSYGTIKCSAEGWQVDRYLIKNNGLEIGVVQVLKKKFLGMVLAYRVNKGPIFIKEFENIENEIKAIELIRKQNPKRPFFYVPYASYSVSALGRMITNKWRIWNIFGFPTGVVDLSVDEEKIRAGLDSKWRNQLKTAEKKGYKILSDFDCYEEMMKLYQKEQEEKVFEGVSCELLNEMKKSPSPLKIFYVKNDADSIIAFDMFYIHGDAATYYIGWNSDEGRKDYLNNLLLYHAAISLKNMGVEKLDLGGIEYIHTESVAKFKDGMKPRHFRQLGEFIKVW